MKIHIGPTRTIAEIQKDFNTQFPFLKIEFFRYALGLESRRPAADIVPQHTRIAYIQVPIIEGDLEVNDTTIVKDLEKGFREQFRLEVQVFRRSGTVWLETTMTDHWTLKQQNDHGKEISTDRPRVTDIPDDYQLTRDADH